MKKETEGKRKKGAFDSEESEFEDSDDPAQLLPGCQGNEIIPNFSYI